MKAIGRTSDAQNRVRMPRKEQGDRDSYHADREDSILSSQPLPNDSQVASSGTPV